MLLAGPFKLSYRNHTISHGTGGHSPYPRAYVVFGDVYPLLRVVSFSPLPNEP